MQVSDFDFELPEARIALRPARPRDAARLLHVVPGAEFGDLGVMDLPDLLQPGDLMVFNDTRVIPAALTGIRPARPVGGGGPASLEINLHKCESADRWRAFARPAKRLKTGDSLDFEGLSAKVAEKHEGGEIVLEFAVSGAALDEAIAAAGAPPLPPYIAAKRGADEADKDDYQTLYAREEGSVAAPTAGLHFTERLFEALDKRGVERAHVTLHVGAGTFLPVKSEDTDDHVMHAEFYDLSEAAAAQINAARKAGRRVIAVGTTALRTLESAADPDGYVRAEARETDIFITPGHQFRAVDLLWTNFHLPKSTLFMLVSAFSGLETMQAAYAHAIAEQYRFYSYGDACLLERA
jgi:S-adenosylmethionine:tRNA ribosyltransferase-isomerase